MLSHNWQMITSIREIDPMVATAVLASEDVAPTPSRVAEPHQAPSGGVDEFGTRWCLSLWVGVSGA